MQAPPLHTPVSIRSPGTSSAITLSTQSRMFRIRARPIIVSPTSGQTDPSFDLLDRRVACPSGQLHRTRAARIRADNRAIDLAADRGTQGRDHGPDARYSSSGLSGLSTNRIRVHLARDRLETARRGVGACTANRRCAHAAELSPACGIVRGCGHGRAGGRTGSVNRRPPPRQRTTRVLSPRRWTCASPPRHPAIFESPAPHADRTRHSPVLAPEEHLEREQRPQGMPVVARA